MKLKIVLGVLALLFLAYFLGPSPQFSEIEFQLDFTTFPNEISNIEDFISSKDTPFNLKEGTSSQFSWARDSIIKTEYSLVYLHGFSASPEEGAPVHKHIAQKYGMNFYAPRLAHHGLNEEEALLDFSTKDFIEDAYEAIKIGELVGEKVIVMSCSTGGTASIYCSAHSDVNIHAQIMYSPNIQLADPKSWLLSAPWGLQLARLVKGGKYHIWDVPAGAEKYWHGKYRLESLVNLQSGLENCMTKETFNKVNQKSMVSYYYKDEDHHDNVVSIEATQNMISQLGTNKNDLHEVIFTEVGAHALQSHYSSKDVASVVSETENYLENILGIKKPL